MKQKAKEGVKNAIKRVNDRKYQVWWTLQSDEFRIRKTKLRKLRKLNGIKDQERKNYIYRALFHLW
jgi:hypothetical protein